MYYFRSHFIIPLAYKSIIHNAPGAKFIPECFFLIHIFDPVLVIYITGQKLFQTFEFSSYQSTKLFNDSSRSKGCFPTFLDGMNYPHSLELKGLLLQWQLPRIYGPTPKWKSRQKHVHSPPRPQPNTYMHACMHAYIHSER